MACHAPQDASSNAEVQRSSVSNARGRMPRLESQKLRSATAGARGKALKAGSTHLSNKAKGVITVNYVNLPPVYLVDCPAHRTQSTSLPIYLAVYHLPQSTSRW